MILKWVLSHRPTNAIFKTTLVILILLYCHSFFQTGKYARVMHKELERTLEQDTVEFETNPFDEMILKNESPSTDILLKLMKDYEPVDDYAYDQEITDKNAEIERCQRYGLKYNPERKTRRRIFFGSMIADESFHAIFAHAAEAYGLYHSVALIESNITINTKAPSPRERNYLPDSLNLRLLQNGIFGHNTKVTVDFYIDRPEMRDVDDWNGIELMMRELITDRWKENGMTPDDIGIVSDVDETFTRDFLLAVQSCDIPEFRHNINCKVPKIRAQTLIFESSPECYWLGRYWWHPDMISGHCIDKIGDEDIHKPVPRHFNGIGKRVSDGDKIFYYKNPHNVTMFPLWKAEEIRTRAGSELYVGTEKHNGFHFHNFFDSIDILRRKYKTYGHPVENADTKSIRDIHEDLALLVNCTTGMNLNPRTDGVGFDKIEGQPPILFQNEEYRNARHNELKGMLEEDIKQHGTNTTI